MRVLVGFPAGGTGDLTARLIAEMAAAKLGQTAMVENRTGANGAIAAEAVARSGVDGLTVLQCPMGTMTIAPNLPGQHLPDWEGPAALQARMERNRAQFRELIQGAGIRTE